MKNLKDKNFREMIDKQMELNWYSERFDDLKEIDSWYSKFETNKETEDKYKEWLAQYLTPFAHKKDKEKEISYFILEYWLKINNRPPSSWDWIYISNKNNNEVCKNKKGNLAGKS